MAAKDSFFVALSDSSFSGPCSCPHFSPVSGRIWDPKTAPESRDSHKYGHIDVLIVLSQLK